MKTKSMTIQNHELAIGQYTLSSLAKVYKTPLYVYDEVQIRDKIATFQTHFKSDHFQTEIVYASKAFLAPYICHLMEELGCSMDSVSLGDLYLMKQSGFPMEKVFLHGNNKTREELLFALEHHVGTVVIDHLQELKTLEELATSLKLSQKVLIRVNPGIEAHTHEYIQTSKIDSKFGESIFDDLTMTQMIRICQDSHYLTLTGFHAHIGSNIHTETAFFMEIETLVKFIVKVKKLTGFETTSLNLGGGFGIQYLDSDPEVDLAMLLQMMVMKLNYLVTTHELALQHVMLEPGRSIVGDAGVTLYTVGGIKKIFNEKKYVFVDGGMTDNIRPALYKAKYSVDIANRPYLKQTELVDVVGKCCESGDIVATNIQMALPVCNDILVVYSTGAYGQSMASNYNGATKSEVIFVRDDEIHIAVHRESLEDLVKSYVFNNQRFFDIHSDMLYDLNQKALDNNHQHFKNFHVSQLIASNIKGSIWTMYSPDDFDLVDSCQRALQEIDMKLLPGFEVILGLEGLRNLKKASDIELLYEMGFRHAMLTWNEENQYATGAKADPTHGLHEEGRDLIRRMESLDMMIDVAHLNERSFYEVLEVSQHNIINSHGNVKALCNHVRNLTDDQMRALRQVDGLMGLTLANNFVSLNKEEQTLDRFLDHVDHAVSIMDVDHVCFGFDFMDYLSEFPNSNLGAVDNATKVYKISEGLKQRGYRAVDIDKICYLNFYSRYHQKIMLRGEVNGRN
ncbi:MAG: diaminopimelate decarboxylase [Bacilli bacterium]